MINVLSGINVMSYKTKLINAISNKPEVYHWTSSLHVFKPLKGPALNPFANRRKWNPLQEGMMNSGSNAKKTDDKEAVEVEDDVEVEAEMKINQTLKREFVLKTVEVELKAIKVSQ